MKNLFLSLALLGFAVGSSSQVIAAEMDFDKVDANTDGSLTFEEVAAAMPNMTEDQFKAADADGDGVLSKPEWTLTQ
ncbi:MAG: hypothetical protein ACR2PM_18550 [Hyphomicrobiales bacterium]